MLLFFFSESKNFSFSPFFSISLHLESFLCAFMFLNIFFGILCVNSTIPKERVSV